MEYKPTYAQKVGGTKFQYVVKETPSTVKTTKKAFGGVEKIISGGETGADSGALKAGVKLGIATGGTAPRGWRTENGSNYELKKFGLKEGTGGFVAISQKVHVALLCEYSLKHRLHDANGTDKTIGCARYKKWIKSSESDDGGFKPVLVIDTIDDSKRTEVIKLIRDFLTRNKDIRVLNVAGHRYFTSLNVESNGKNRETTAGVPDFANKVESILVEALKVDDSD